MKEQKKGIEIDKDQLIARKRRKNTKKGINIIQDQFNEVKGQNLEIMTGSEEKEIGNIEKKIVQDKEDIEKILVNRELSKRMIEKERDQNQDNEDTKKKE